MSRKYSHMQEYEERIIELYNQGETLREIGNKFGFIVKQMKDSKQDIIKNSEKSKQEKLSKREEDHIKRKESYPHQFND